MPTWVCKYCLPPPFANFLRRDTINTLNDAISLSMALPQYLAKDAKLSLRLTARDSLSTEVRLSAMRMVHALILFKRSDTKFSQLCL